MCAGGSTGGRRGQADLRGRVPEGYGVPVFAKILALTLLAALVWPAAKAPSQTIRHGYAVEPPLAFRDEEGRPAGFVIETLDLAAAHINAAVEHVELARGDRLHALMDGRVDVVSGFAISLRRLERFAFSLPYLIADAAVVGLKPRPPSFAEVFRSGLVRLGVERDSDERDELVAKEGRPEFNFRLKLFDDADLCLDGIAAGTVDACLADEAFARARAKSRGAVILGTPPFARNRCAFAAKKADFAVVDAISLGLSGVLGSKRHGEVLRKYAP